MPGSAQSHVANDDIESVDDVDRSYHTPSHRELLTQHNLPNQPDTAGSWLETMMNMVTNLQSMINTGGTMMVQSAVPKAGTSGIVPMEGATAQESQSTKPHVIGVGGLCIDSMSKEELKTLTSSLMRQKESNQLPSPTASVAMTTEEEQEKISFTQKWEVFYQALKEWVPSMPEEPVPMTVSRRVARMSESTFVEPNRLPLHPSIKQVCSTAQEQITSGVKKGKDKQIKPGTLLASEWMFLEDCGHLLPSAQK